MSIQKSLLQSFISKYSLGGAIESVAWEGTSKSLRVKVISDDKSLLGELELKDPVSEDFDGQRMGIFKTSKLVKLLSVLEEDINVSLNVINDQPKSIKLSDKASTKENFALADLALIPTVPPLKADNMPKEFEVSVKLNEKFVDVFTKAKSALPEVVTFAVNATAKKVEIILGQTDVNTDTITFTAETSATEAIEKLFFNADLFKEIISANKGSEAEFLVSKEGIGKIVYDTKEYKATYYLVARTAG